MPWFRVGDTIATDPRVTVLHDPKNPLAAPACVGFLTLLGTLSTQHGTDYVIHPGFLHLAGGSAASDLLRRCIRAGLITPLGGRGDDRRWKLIDDAPELFHLRLKDEVAWEKQQKADTHKKDHLVAVVLRDGDACRWCGIPVQPKDTISARGRTLDHLRPGLAARGPHDLVVACKGCNSKRNVDRQATKDDETPEAFAARWAPRLLPIPDQLFFVRSDAAMIESAGRTIPPGSVVVELAYPARNNPSTTPQAPGPDETHHATPARVAPPEPGTTAPADQHPATPAGVAATGASPTTTRPVSQPSAASPPAADQHPATQAGVAATANTTSAPECTQHPAATAGVAGPESRTNQPTTNWSGAGGPGRVESGSGREGPAPPPGHPPDPPPPSTSTPRRTRRGRRRPRPA